MISVGLISTIIIAVVVGVFVRMRSLRRDLDRLEHVGYWRAEFFSATAQLATDDDVPTPVSRTLGMLAEHIDHPTIGGAVLRSLIATRNAGREALKGPHPSDELSPVSRQAFAQALYSFMLSVGFGDRKHGKAILQVLAEVLAEANRETITTKAIDDFARRERREAPRELVPA